jgi:hypothetical protein
VWDDAECDVGWESEFTPILRPVLTLGFVIAETKKHIVVSSTISRDQDNGTNLHNCRIQIPKKMILSRRELIKKAP